MLRSCSSSCSRCLSLVNDLCRTSYGYNSNFARGWTIFNFRIPSALTAGLFTINHFRLLRDSSCERPRSVIFRPRKATVSRLRSARRCEIPRSVNSVEPILTKRLRSPAKFWRCCSPPSVKWFPCRDKVSTFFNWPNISVRLTAMIASFKFR